MTKFRASLFRLLGAGLGLAVGGLQGQSGSADPTLQAILEQNRKLQEQVDAQQKTIEALTRRLDAIDRTAARQDRELQGLQDRGPATDRPPPVESDREHEVRIGAEAALSYFSTGGQGQFPKSEFRVDDTKVTLEAPVWKDVYFFTELNLLTRESNAANFQFGELYVEFGGLGSALGSPDALTVRVGSVNIPFGEEYQVRNPLSNPLISHSLSDIWGPDEGVEAFGRVGRFSYALAVQNGGLSQLRDFNADKSLTGRIGFDPTSWLHLSASAMRTGEVATVSPVTSTGDNLTAIWFANAFFRALGPASRTTSFWANLYEGDAIAKWKGGQLAVAYGEVKFDDSDPVADNARTLKYGYAEAVQSLTDELYGAARYSEINVAGGYPLAGWGNAGTFFYRPSLTDELRRLSVGFGYRFGPPLVLKLEYSWENGHMVNGVSRDHEDFFGAQVGVRF
ncbi:MAG: hypothetical protein JSR48_16150 [Verrucomicrobia bacterium]|nr:hypothetical protein [Verrucomicrobiota bacterium]